MIQLDKYTNIKKVSDLLSQLLNVIEENSVDNNFELYVRTRIKSYLRLLEQQGYDIKYLEELTEVKDFKEFCDITEKVEDTLKNDLYTISANQYSTHNINGNEYKFKSIYFSEYDEINILRLASFSGITKEEINSLVASIQKGIHFNVGSEMVSTLKGGYECYFNRVQDENIGDGYHGCIYQVSSTMDQVLIIFDENPVKVVFDYIEKNIDKTGILPSWSTYIYNQLVDLGLLKECDGFNYDTSSYSPKKVLVLSRDIDNELIMNIKMKGIKNGDIKLPVRDNVLLSSETTFSELVDQYVIPNIETEVCDYNIGEPISENFKNPIFKKNKKVYLYPRQQVMAQGMENALFKNKNNLFLNGGMGVGKTLISASTITSYLRDKNKTNARIVVYCQGHLIPKWKREWQELLKGYSITPTFYEINKFSDIAHINKNIDGLEIFLLSKDKAKRSYMKEYIGIDKFKRKNLWKIDEFKKSLKDITEEKIIVREWKDSITIMRLAASLTADKYNKPVILYKPVFDINGQIEEYKIVTSSKKMKQRLNSKLSYDIKVKNLSEFLKGLDYEEIRHNRAFSLKISNGIVCPYCGGFHYENPLEEFDTDKKDKRFTCICGSRTSKNGKHRHYLKANGTELLSNELKDIINEKASYIITDKKTKNPYLDMDGVPLDADDINKIKSGKYKDEYSILIKLCNHPTWGAVKRKGYNVVNTADMMIKKFGKKSFDFLIADEAHLFQAESAQGLTFAKLCKLSKNRIMLTGTLTNGKASSLFYMFYALFPHKMKAAGYKYSDVSLWVEHYGRRKEVEKERLSETYNKTGIGKRTSTGWQEIPGISPLLYSNFLSDIMVSRTIEDMAIPMPEIKYIAHKIEMSDELLQNYSKLKNDMINFMKLNPQIPLGGAYLHNLMAYPDNPNQPPIYAMEQLVANPNQIDLEGLILPKERKLIDTIKKEVLVGRRTLVYTNYTGDKGVSKRLIKVLSDNQIKVEELTSSISLEKREKWIQTQYDKGVSVIITNPKCVETGLDIYGYPNIYFYGTGWDIKTIRQAEKRSWRIGQAHMCKVYYSYYLNTIQEDCVKLVGSKKKASLAIEGKFDEDFLTSLGDTTDSGSKLLFKMLQGKVQLKESELDAFGFEEDSDESYSVDSQLEKSSANKCTSIETNLFTVSEDILCVVNKSKNKSKRAVVGQLGFFEI